MNKYLALAVQILLVSALAAAQDLPTKSLQLNRTLTEFYQAGKFDEAIPLSEEVVALERRGSRPQNLVNALENLARIRFARFNRAVASLNSGSVAERDVRATVTDLHQDARSGEAALREAIRLTVPLGEKAAEQAISLRNELAWVLYNYQPPDPESSVGFDKTARDKFEMRTRARYLARIDEARTLYNESIAYPVSGQADNERLKLLSRFKAAEFALATGDLEAAMTRSQECIAEVERSFGVNDANLIKPIEIYVKVLSATGQEDAAFEALSRLARLKRGSAEMPRSLLNLSLRAERSFAPINAASVESKARANKERAGLAGRAATLESSYDAMLAVSTNGRQYYDAAGLVSISKVAVRVLIDEGGKVVEAEGLTTDKDKKADAESAVREWKFRPFLVAGKATRMKGFVECIILSDRQAK